MRLIRILKSRVLIDAAPRDGNRNRPGCGSHLVSRTPDLKIRESAHFPSHFILTYRRIPKVNTIFAIASEWHFSYSAGELIIIRKRDVMKTKLLLAAAAASLAVPALAEDQGPPRSESDAKEIIVTGTRLDETAGLKTATPLIETPQPITIITDDTYLSQGAVSIADTLRYASGAVANAFGPDGRVDSTRIRGISPLQFRDGMRDIYSFYASIRADPYNFSRVEIVRGPASVLFGNGSIGGLVNLVSKVPTFETGGEVAVRYGSFDRKEILADIDVAAADNLGARVVGRFRDADTQTNFIQDDRVMLAPSVRWAPTADTDVTLIGLYQEDDGGSVSQFPPLVGTLLPNPNGQLPNDLFVGKPGWDRYDGRLAQGTGLVEHRFNEDVTLSVKARYIDSDLTYFSHYPNSYGNPLNPYLDDEQRQIELTASGNYAELNVFSTDNNLQWKLGTGSNVEHTLLAGVDYSWNEVLKTASYGSTVIDIYDIDYDAIPDYDGGLPNPETATFTDVAQDQLGFYFQDQVRFWDRMSVVLGVRRDEVNTKAAGAGTVDHGATSFRAGIIGEIVPGVSPFFSYTESFEIISGTTADGSPFVPKRGRQYEAGVKFHPDAATIITATAYDIEESNRPVSDPNNPLEQIQIGTASSRGIEVEATRRLPDNYDIIANYSYNEAEDDATGRQLDNVPKTVASLWGTKTFFVGNGASLRFGAGVRHVGENFSYGAAFPNGLRTPSNTLVDALAELRWEQWRVSVNATNLFGEDYYAACLARGDCFVGEDRNVFATLSYDF